jgi:hypothetical protein
MMNRIALQSRAQIEVDAELAYARLTGELALICRGKSPKAQRLGQVASARYRQALEAAATGPAPGKWTRFVRTVQALVRELDRCPVRRSVASCAARGDLDRLISENVDLLERRLR